MSSENIRPGTRSTSHPFRYSLMLLVPAMLRPANSHAVLLTFSDQLPNSGPMDRGDGSAGNVYTGAQGMPNGSTATFTGFHRYGAFDSSTIYFRPLGHDHTGGSFWKAIYPTGDSASIDFTIPVQLPSLWFDNSSSSSPPDPSIGDPGYTLEIVGSLKGNTVWTYDYPWPPNAAADGFVPPYLFQQVTLGTGLAIDHIEFNSGSDVGVDDITISAATLPEPIHSMSALAVLGLITLKRRRRFSCCR